MPSIGIFVASSDIAVFTKVFLTLMVALEHQDDATVKLVLITV